MKTQIENYLSSLGWEQKKDKEQIFGSCADYYAEYLHEEQNCFIWINDGAISMLDAIYNIYATIGVLESKIFEGRIETFEELQIVMKVLGFKELKIENEI